MMMTSPGPSPVLPLGGPATTVTWRRDEFVITLSATYQQTKRIVDPVAGTSQTVLTIDQTLIGMSLWGHTAAQWRRVF